MSRAALWLGMALLLAGAAWDVFSTLEFLRMGMRELNPIAAFLLDRWGPRSLLILKGIGVLIVIIVSGFFYRRGHRISMPLCLMALGLLWIAAAVNNTLLIASIAGT